MITQANCPNCKTPMHRVRIEQWMPTNLLLKQLQRIIDSAGVTIFHCKQCGKVEFYRAIGK